MIASKQREVSSIVCSKGYVVGSSGDLWNNIVFLTSPTDELSVESALKARLELRGQLRAFALSLTHNLLMLQEKVLRFLSMAVFSVSLLLSTVCCQLFYLVLGASMIAVMPLAMVYFVLRSIMKCFSSSFQRIVLTKSERKKTSKLPLSGQPSKQQNSDAARKNDIFSISSEKGKNDKEINYSSSPGSSPTVNRIKGGRGASGLGGLCELCKAISAICEACKGLFACLKTIQEMCAMCIAIASCLKECAQACQVLGAALAPIFEFIAVVVLVWQLCLPVVLIIVLMKLALFCAFVPLLAIAYLPAVSVVLLGAMFKELTLRGLLVIGSFFSMRQFDGPASLVDALFKAIFFSSLGAQELHQMKGEEEETEAYQEVGEVVSQTENNPILFAAAAGLSPSINQRSDLPLINNTLSHAEEKQQPHEILRPISNDTGQKDDRIDIFITGEHQDHLGMSTENILSKLASKEESRVEEEDGTSQHKQKKTSSNDGKIGALELNSSTYDDDGAIIQKEDGKEHQQKYVTEVPKTNSGFCCGKKAVSSDPSQHTMRR
uniref:Uncharacterized protein n=1 Tax=Heterosigma akashiwo TaxID=2829 RepID=A0A7S3UUE6_HETAK